VKVNTNANVRVAYLFGPQPKENTMSHDSQLKLSVLDELKWEPSVDAAHIGVTGVSNNATIKTRVNTGNLSDAIGYALNRSWFYDSDIVAVSADGGKVRLTGTVETWHDREVAGSTAWAAPGATAVENSIVMN
jgi:osmotically-inducible protein OsmY